MNILSENWSNEVELHGWQPELEVNGDMHEYHQMVIWLNDNIDNLNANVMWTYAHHPVFRFRKSKDQAWFLLRWS